MLATNAARSVLECTDTRLRVLISNNSTDQKESEQLVEFVTGCVDARLSLVRPSDPLPMTRHWDWALNTLLADPDLSHIVVLTDRMMYKHGTLPELLSILSQYPNDIVTFNHDRVVDNGSPITINLAD